MRSLSSLLIACTLGLASAGAFATKPTPPGMPAQTPSVAPSTSQTLELHVEGLNCALCSEAMRASLLKATGGRDIEPRLECGRIFVEVPQGAVLNESAVNFTLQANGFNLKDVAKASRSLEQVRARKEC